jgi:hypothetical protein
MPDSGTQTAIVSSAGGILDLGFDPGTATTSRVDNNLVFEVDGGGTVTITDFFVVGDQALPTLRLPDGTLVASADFFDGSGLDMSTAAGPTAAGPTPGSGTSYADDSGSLMGGVDKFGMLGTDYWSRATEPGLEAAGTGTDATVTPPPGPAGDPFVPGPDDADADANADADAEVPLRGVEISVLAGMTLHESSIKGSANPNGFSGTGWGQESGPNLADEPVQTNGGIKINGNYESAEIKVDGKTVMSSLPSEVGESKTATFNIDTDQWVLADSIEKGKGGDQITITKTGDGTYEFTYTLNQAKDHTAAKADPENTDDTVKLNLEVIVSGQNADGESITATASYQVSVVDDGIAAKFPGGIVLEVTPPTDYLVTVVFDMSYSMAYLPDRNTFATGNQESRFDIAQKALLTMLKDYQMANGDVLVNLVLFSTAAQTNALGGQPMSVADAIKAVEALTRPTSVNAGTDYNTALTLAQPMVEAGLMNYPDHVKQVFFISDGEPTRGQETPQAWINFVKDSGERGFVVYALGVGPEVNGGPNGALNTVVDTPDNFVFVANFADLGAILQELADVTTGNLAAENILGADGVSQIFAYTDADGKHEFPWDDPSKLDEQGFFSLMLVDDGQGNSAELRINQEGNYTLIVRGDVPAGKYDNISLILLGGDGDKLADAIGIIILPEGYGYDPVNDVILPPMLEAYDKGAHAGWESANDLFKNVDPAITNAESFGNAGWQRSGGSITYNVNRPAAWQNDNNLDGNDRGFTVTSGTSSSTPNAAGMNALRVILGPDSGTTNADTLAHLNAAFGINAQMSSSSGTTGGVNSNANTFFRTYSVTSKDFLDVKEGAEIAFNWQFRQGANNNQDAAIYVIKDEHGNVVAEGRLNSAPVNNTNWQQGVIRFDAPADGKYTLSLVVLCVGGNSAASLFIDDVVVTYMGPDHFVISGNVIHDNALAVGQDKAFDSNTSKTPAVTALFYDGEWHEFTGRSMSITTEKGVLTMNANGNYTFKANPGMEMENISDEIGYRLTLGNETSEAWLFIRPEGYEFENYVFPAPAPGSDGTDIAMFGAMMSDDFDPGIYHGTDGDDIIFPEGASIVYGNGGNDVFAWLSEHLDGGTTKIMDFQLGTDHLRFDDLIHFGNDIDALLVSGRLHLTAIDDKNLVLHINDALGHEKTVEIHLENQSIDAVAINNVDSEQAAQLLHQMILTSSTG